MSPYTHPHPRLTVQDSSCKGSAWSWTRWSQCCKPHCADFSKESQNCPHYRSSTAKLLISDGESWICIMWMIAKCSMELQRAHIQYSKLNAWQLQWLQTEFGQISHLKLWLVLLHATCFRIVCLMRWLLWIFVWLKFQVLMYNNFFSQTLADINSIWCMCRSKQKKRMLRIVRK